MEEELIGNLKKWKLCGILLCLFGVCLSAYSLNVEWKHETEKDYVAYCDISPRVSCSKAFGSRYGKGMGLLQYFVGEKSPYLLPNSFYGEAMYGVLLFFGCFNVLFISRLKMVILIFANLASIYLAYILYFVLYNFCIVCVTVYVVNFLLLICSLREIHYMKELSKESDTDLSHLMNMKKRA